jgi:hypothetical protein
MRFPSYVVPLNYCYGFSKVGLGFELFLLSSYCLWALKPLFYFFCYSHSIPVLDSHNSLGRKLVDFTGKWGAKDAFRISFIVGMQRQQILEQLDGIFGKSKI